LNGGGFRYTFCKTEIGHERDAPRQGRRPCPTDQKDRKSVGVILPKDLLARLNLKEGDKFYSGRATGWQPAPFAL